MDYRQGHFRLEGTAGIQRELPVKAEKSF